MLSKAVQPGRSRPEAHSPWQSCCRVSLPVSCVRCDASSSAQHPAPTPPPTATPDPSRRNLLQLATVGSLSAWAARNVDAADAASGAALAASLGSDGSGGGSSSALLERRLGDALSEFELSNGLRFLVFERHTAPVVSFHVYADVGAYDEEDGQTGAPPTRGGEGCLCLRGCPASSPCLPVCVARHPTPPGIAHLLEHMAFKGTRRLGTTDAAREGRLLDELDDAFYSLLAAAGQDGSAEAARLQRQFDELQQQVRECVGMDGWWRLGWLQQSDAPLNFGLTWLRCAAGVGAERAQRVRQPHRARGRRGPQRRHQLRFHPVLLELASQQAGAVVCAGGRALPAACV